jgi:hypothetical protein
MVEEILVGTDHPAALAEEAESWRAFFHGQLWNVPLSGAANSVGSERSLLLEDLSRRVLAKTFLKVPGALQVPSLADLPKRASGGCGDDAHTGHAG